MTLHKLTLLLALGCAGVANAQPAKLAWSRTNLYAGVAIDTVGQGIVNSAGNFVLVGADNQVGQLPRGNITVINRKTAAMNFIDIVPPGAGPLGLSRIMEDEGIYYVFGTTRPVGSNSDQIYVGKFDLNLNLLKQATFNANTYAGTESVTDVGINANNRIFMTGIAQKNNIWQVWTAATETPLDSFSLNFAKVDVTVPTLPQMTVNGIIAILIGFVGNTGPTLRSYQPTGALNFSWGATVPASATNFSLNFEEVKQNYVYGGASWTDEILPGSPVSHGSVFRINTTNGVGDALFQVPDIAGANKIVLEDILISSLASRRVNALFRRNNRTESVSLNESLAPQSTWTDPLLSSFAEYIAAPAWGDIIMALGRENSIECTYGIAVNNAPRFSINGPVYNMILPYIEQDNLFHLASGDMLAIRSNAGQMQINCIQQAPTAVTESFQPKSGVTFRPLLPVTTNDRYAEGSGISIVQMPAHGTLTMGSNGFFNYKSTPGYTGPDSFRYRLTKAALNTSEATINLTVKP